MKCCKVFGSKSAKSCLFVVVKGERRKVKKTFHFSRFTPNKAFNLYTGIFNRNLIAGLVPVAFFMLSYKAASFEINVSNFGAVPGDGKDDSKAILAAIEYAKANDIHTVRFNAGIYEFKGLPGWDTSESEKRSCYITLHDVAGLELRGDTDMQGNPATFWVKDNDLKKVNP